MTAITVLLAVSACAPSAIKTYEAPPPYQMTKVFDAEYAKRVLDGGNASISGQAFLRTRGGMVKTCAGQTVELIPATSFAIEYYANRYGTKPFHNTLSLFEHANARKAGPIPDEFERYRLVSKCDAEGRFAFQGIPGGQYYVKSVVYWSIPGSYGYQGGYMIDVVVLEDGEDKKLIISR